MYKFINKLILFSLFVLLAGCSHDHEHETGEEHGHEHGSSSVTMWSDSTEIFMEYPALVAGKEAKFLIHLSDMKDFGAVTEGTLKIDFVNTNGGKFTVTEDKPARAGIYTPTVTFNNAGIYKMILTLSGKQASDRIEIDNIKVYSTEAELPHGEEEGSSISFLKEQQWKIDFATEPALVRKLQGSIKVTGEILAKPENHSKVVSPLSGIVLSKDNSNLKSLGSFVRRGETLLYISPAADAGSNIQKVKSDYLLSKSEYERVKNLFEKKAVSQKRLDEAKFDFESKQASYNSLAEQIKFTEDGYSITSPIDGYIENISFKLGDQITAGQELFTVINPSRLILQANVPTISFEEANNSKNASFKVEGLEDEYSITSLNGKKLSIGAVINRNNRTVPVYYEFSNPQNKIKVGMYAEVFIKVSEPADYLTIPVSAIVDEDGLRTAYIQLEGEAFEKRILKTGMVDKGYIQVLEGLKEGERIVTNGAYQVRLAALSPESAIGHGHVH